MDKPLVSVVVPCYNHEAFVQESMRSILAQTYPRIELIVVNDGSTDSSYEKIMALENECRRRFVNFECVIQENKGLTASLNAGIKRSAGEYVATVDADDRCLPNMISDLMDCFLSADARLSVAVGDAYLIEQSGQRAWFVEPGRKSDEIGKGYERFVALYTRKRTDFDLKKDFGFYWTFLRSNYIPAMAVLMRKSAMVKAGLYDEWSKLQDLDMWLKLSKEYPLAYVGRPVVEYRFHGENSVLRRTDSLNDTTLRLLLREKRYCYRHGLARVWIESFSYFLHYSANRGRYDMVLKYLLRSMSWGVFASLVKIALRKIKKTVAR